MCRKYKIPGEGLLLGDLQRRNPRPFGQRHQAEIGGELLLFQINKSRPHCETLGADRIIALHQTCFSDYSLSDYAHQVAVVTLKHCTYVTPWRSRCLNRQTDLDDAAFLCSADECSAERASGARGVCAGPLHAHCAQRRPVREDHRAGLEEPGSGLHADEQRLLPLTLHLHHPPGDLQHRWTNTHTQKWHKSGCNRLKLVCNLFD